MDKKCKSYPFYYVIINLSFVSHHIIIKND